MTSATNSQELRELTTSAISVFLIPKLTLLKMSIRIYDYSGSIVEVKYVLSSLIGPLFIEDIT
jgi:hypothetical protein